MAKRGRRSIRNKRKSVKKYSSKRRSKTMRYLRGGGVLSDDDVKRMIAEQDQRRDIKHTLLRNDYQQRLASMKQKDRDAHDARLDAESDDEQGGGRRRYHRRKQSKSRSRKH
jgi:hypothetical protein